MQKHVIVIGGGVVGLATAYSLMKSGVKVTVLEANSAFATETSFANGGQLSYRYVAPLADAGVISQGIKWMGKSDSPLNLKLRANAAQIAWLVKFSLACNRKTNKENAEHLLRLSLLSQEVMKSWREDNSLEDFAWSKSGKLIIFRQQKAFLKSKESANIDFQHILSADDIIQKEPSLSRLSSSLVGGIYTPTEETADCYLFCQSLLKKLQETPDVKIQHNTLASDFIIKGNKVLGVKTNQGDYLADDIVLCTGNQGNLLLKKIHLSLPIIGLKGYSLTLPYPKEEGIVPKTSVTDYDNKIVYAKLGNKLRIAAMVDIGFDNVDIRSNRIDALKTITQDTFPQLDLTNEVVEWSGLRPSTPKSPPILGQSPFNNLWLNVGHGSLGFTLAAGSAAIINELITQNTSSISLQGLSL